MLRTISLDGKWGFAIDPQNRGLDWCQYQIRNPKNPYPEGAGDLHECYEDLLLDEVDVPGCWQLYKPEYKWYQGTAFFIRTFKRPQLTAKERVFIHFEGVSFRARIWLNGNELEVADVPYLPLMAEITDLLEDDNYLCLRIEGDSRTDDTLPQFGWMNYAGIIRPASLLITGSKRMEQVLIDPELDLNKCEGRLKIRIASDIGFSAGEKIIWNLQGHGLCIEKEIDIDGNGTDREFSTPFTAVDFWSPDNPALYHVSIKWISKDGNELDVYEKNVGFREFVAENGKFILNGKEIFLRGISRHNIHPDYGMTVPLEEIRRDIEQIVELGCNAVRLPHYPQDTKVLDECDRQGLLTWVEIPVYWDAPLENRVTRQRMLTQLELMVRRDYNHPSVAIWSMANEIHSDRAETLACFRKARKLIRSFDQQRPVTFASWPRDADANLGLKMVDMCCLNRYRGWYDPDCGKIAEELDEVHKVYPDKPMFLSEFGAGAQPGCHDPEKSKGSEEYQAMLLADILNIARKHACGACIWVFADFADPSRVLMKMSNGFINNKGLLSEDRKHRKLAFETVKQIYNNWKKEDKT
jgi:beta-glucuronidase